MTWLASGIVLGPFYAVAKKAQRMGVRTRTISLEIGLLFYSAPAIGGFVVVAQMLNVYGRCVRIY
jgi:predicted membrane protein